MKRESGLIHRIAAPDNVRMAFYKAARSKWHKADVRIFQDNLDMNLYCIRQLILDGEVHISPYHQFCIYEPKERVITAAEFRDRVLHHALMLVCHERFEKHLIFDT